eukprot:6127556-Pyramimonas_sp.AAC.1
MSISALVLAALSTVGRSPVLVFRSRRSSVFSSSTYRVLSSCRYLPDELAALGGCSAPASLIACQSSGCNSIAGYPAALVVSFWVAFPMRIWPFQRCRSWKAG